MKCPVCRTECNDSIVCPECGFEDITTGFLSKKEAEQWYENIVWPWRRNYWKKLDDFIIEDTTLIRYSGNSVVVTVPHGVTEIAEEAFVRNGINSYGREVCVGTRSIKEIQLPDSIKIIGKNAFWACEELESIHLSNNLTVISKGAFGCCERLKSINIPAKVNVIEEDAFLLCDSLEEITVESDNENYYVRWNCLVDSIQKKIVSAFSNCTIPDDGSVTHIAKRAFYDVERGEPLFIPKTITHIEKDAFGHGQYDIMCEVEKKPRGWNKCWAISFECEGKVFWNQKR